MRAAFHLYRRLVGIQIRAQLQYPASFWFEMLSQVLVNFGFFASVGLVFQRFGSIAGWRIGEVAFLWGLVDTSFAIANVLFSGFEDDVFSVLVRTGALDQLLLRPTSATLQVLGGRLVVRRVGRIAQGLIIFAIGLSLLEVRWTLAKLVYLPLVALSMVAFFGGLLVIGATITFWTIQPVEAINVFTYGGSEMMSYPMHIYPPWMQRFFTFVVPAIFMNYAPALFLLDKPDPIGLPPFAPFLAPFAGAVVLWLALRFWNFGLSYYQGTGS